MGFKSGPAHPPQPPWPLPCWLTCGTRLCGHCHGQRPPQEAHWGLLEERHLSVFCLLTPLAELGAWSPSFCSSFCSPLVSSPRFRMNVCLAVSAGQKRQRPCLPWPSRLRAPCRARSEPVGPGMTVQSSAEGQSGGLAQRLGPAVPEAALASHMK